MPFGRKFANRILLAYLVPLSFLLVVGIVFAYFAHFRIGRIAAGGLLVLVPALLIGRLLTRRDAARFAQLRRSAEQIERGHYHARLPVSEADDEYADLARAFNHMADVLAARESALRDQNLVLVAQGQRMESVLNATNDGIALLTREGRFALVNRRFCEMLGTKPELVLHQGVEDVQPHLVERLAQPERLMSHMAALTLDDLRDPIGVAEEVIELAKPDRRFVQVYTAPVRGENGTEVIGRIIALRDVTRERELDNLKTDFISVVSHELRTPLTSIKGYTDLLLSGAAEGSAELQQEFLGIIQSSTTRLSNLINDILDISRIESGKVDIKHEPIDYRRIVADTLRLLRAAADGKQIVMDASLPETMPPVRGDTDKVAQVLTNLVSNAIKYTPPGGWVKVWLEVSGGSVTTCVQDSGIGIAPEDQKKLFQKFFRADNTSTREAGGTGLGLVIAKTTVELLGGAIWVESEPGRGTRFYFTLPLSLEGYAADIPAPRSPLPERGIGLVLVVNDDSYVRGIIQHFLHRRGYGTQGAASAAEALQKARQHKPDAITLDILMPGMDGFHVLRALQSDPATEGIPVVIVSVVGDPARGVLALSAFSFVRKPAEAAQLSNTIAAAAAAHCPPRRGSDLSAPAYVLYMGDAPGDESRERAALVSELAAQGITLYATPVTSEALAEAVTTSPCVILMDMALPDEDLFDLICALKAEEQAARIPIVMLTNDIAPTGFPVYAGGDRTDNTLSLEYVGEQLARLLSSPVPAK